MLCCFAVGPPVPGGHPWRQPGFASLRTESPTVSKRVGEFDRCGVHIESSQVGSATVWNRPTTTEPPRGDVSFDRDTGNKTFQLGQGRVVVLSLEQMQSPFRALRVSSMAKSSTLTVAVNSVMSKFISMSR